MITVFHNKDFMSGEKIEACNLKKVAEVNTDNLEEAFQFTNSIECLWTENFADGRLGTAFVEKCRSTSVGDVMEWNGDFIRVDDFGFKMIDNPFSK